MSERGFYTHQKASRSIGACDVIVSQEIRKVWQTEELQEFDRIDMFASQKLEAILIRIEKAELGSSRKVCCRGPCISSLPVDSRN